MHLPIIKISPTTARRLADLHGKVEFHPGELIPRVGFIVTNRSLPNERVLAFYNNRGTAEQQIKEGKYALKWDAVLLHALCG